MSIKQISIFIENKPGMLCAMTDVLAQSGVDLRAFTLSETIDFGIARIVVDDVYKASTTLKDAGYVHSISDVLGVAVPDVPGGLNKVLQAFSDTRINVEYMYVFQSHKTIGTVYTVFKVADNAAAAAALTKAGIKVVNQGELENL